MQTNTCQMKTNFAEFQEKQFAKRNKVVVKAVAEEVKTPKESKEKSNKKK